MATKTILLATADLQTVVDVNEALGAEWAVTHAASEAETLAQLEAGSFDALLVDFNLSDPDASELLNQASEKCPDLTRFLFACEADLALVAAKLEGEYEVLPKPIDPDSLKSRIEKGIADPKLCDDGVATGFDTASSIPSVYAEVLEALESPGVTSKQVGAIIASDAELTREVLGLTKSTYRGLPGNITDPAQAVEVLGAETVKALVMALRFLAEHSHVRPGYLSLETIWRHSTNVARIARDLVLFETKDRAMAAQALAAGLVHDLGKVVLSTNFDDLYGRVHSLARNQPVALWDIEKEMFGATHGEIGACLVGMWNLPIAVVDATALHHEPPVGESDKLTPLAAVHIANVLAHQLQASEEFRVAPVVSTPFLNQLGLLQRLPVWRATFGNQRSHAVSDQGNQPHTPATPASLPADDAVSWTANELQDPAAEELTRTSTATDAKSDAGHPAARGLPQHWIFMGVAAVVMLSLALFFRLEVDREEPLPVHARPLPVHEAVTVAPPIPVTEALVVAVPQEAVALPAPEKAIATIVPESNPSAAVASAEPEISVPVVAEPAIAEPTPEVIPVVVPETTIAIAAPVSAPAEQVEQVEAPAFRLNGIFYNTTKPSAIVNGKSVLVGERVNGAIVLSISRSAVVLDLNGEQTTLIVPLAK